MESDKINALLVTQRDRMADTAKAAIEEANIYRTQNIEYSARLDQQAEEILRLRELLATAYNALKDVEQDYGTTGPEYDTRANETLGAAFQRGPKPKKPIRRETVLEVARVSKAVEKHIEKNLKPEPAKGYVRAETA